MNEKYSHSSLEDLAKKVKSHCAEVAKEQLLEASIQGLCLEGAIEVAIGSIHSIDVNKLITDIESEP